MCVCVCVDYTLENELIALGRFFFWIATPRSVNALIC